MDKPNPYDEGTPEWEMFENGDEDDSEPMQFPKTHGLMTAADYLIANDFNFPKLT